MQRAPTPKNEKPAVTIANLERENDNLAARIDYLAKLNIDCDRSMNEWRTAAKTADRRVVELLETVRHLESGLETAQAKIAKLESVLCGYRQAIMDVNGHIADVVAK